MSLTLTPTLRVPQAAKPRSLLKTALNAVKRADRINYTRVEWGDWSRRPYCKGCGVAFADDYDTSQPANRAATYLCPTCEQGIASEPDGVML